MKTLKFEISNELKLRLMEMRKLLGGLRDPRDDDDGGGGGGCTNCDAICGVTCSQACRASCVDGCDRACGNVINPT